MGLAYRVPSTLQQKALRDLHKSFYIFATVIVFFAVLGFLFIVWYYGALHFSSNNTNNDSTSSMNEVDNVNSSSSRSAFLRANPVRFSSSPINPEVVGTFLKQEGGVSGMFESTRIAVWLFSIAHINVSVPTGGFFTVATHNTIMVVDASNDIAVQTSYHTNLLMDDMHVTSMIGIGASVYLFYSQQHSNTYGVGKLLYSNNNTLIFNIVHSDLLLPGPVIMATARDTNVFLYCQQGAQVQVLSLPRYIFEVMAHNGQLWASSKSDHNNPLDKFSNSTSLGSAYIQPLLEGDNDTTVLYSVEWNEYMEQYVMLSAKDNQVQVWHSHTPQGPFTVSFIQTVSNHVTHTYFHKEMWRGAGRVMVFTYCTDGNSGSLAHLAEIECNIEKPV